MIDIQHLTKRFACIELDMTRKLSLIKLANYWRQQFGTDRNRRAKSIINLEILFG